MTQILANPRHVVIVEEALERLRLVSTRPQPAAWSFPLGGQERHAMALLEDGLLRVGCALSDLPEPARPPAANTFARMLEWSSQLPGGARFCRRAYDRGFRDRGR